MYVNKLSTLAFLLCAGFSTAAMAQSGAAQEITQISEEVAVLNARKARLVLQNEIDAREQERMRSAGGTANIQSGEFRSLPRVKAIEGVDGRMIATLIYPGGAEQVVRPGETTSNGWRVAAMDVRSVTLQRGKEKARLVFGNDASPIPNNDSHGPVPGAQPAGGGR